MNTSSRRTPGATATGTRPARASHGRAGTPGPATGEQSPVSLRKASDVTAAEWAGLMERYCTREPVADIAASAGLSASQIVYHAHQLNLTRPRRNAKEEIKTRGPVSTWPRIPLARVGVVFGLKRQTVYMLRYRGDLPEHDADGRYDRDWLLAWGRQQRYTVVDVDKDAHEYEDDDGAPDESGEQQAA